MQKTGESALKVQSVTPSGIFVFFFFVLWDGWGENTVMLHENKRV